MRQIIGFLGSIGVGLMLTAAGLVLDAKSLIYSGLIIFALMVALWLWSWARPVAATVGTDAPTLPLATATPQDRAIAALATARINALKAVAMRNEDAGRRAFHEIEAALLTARAQFNVQIITVEQAGTYREALKAYIAFIDEILPHLRQGHLDQARRRAAAFTF